MFQLEDLLTLKTKALLEVQAMTNDLPSFSSECPNGHLAPQSGFSPEELRDGLRAETIRFYCIQCDARWKPRAEETSNILRLVAG